MASWTATGCYSVVKAWEGAQAPPLRRSARTARTTRGNGETRPPGMSVSVWSNDAWGQKENVLHRVADYVPALARLGPHPIKVSPKSVDAVPSLRQPNSLRNWSTVAQIWHKLVEISTEIGPTVFGCFVLCPSAGSSRDKGSPCQRACARQFVSGLYKRGRLPMILLRSKAHNGCAKPQAIREINDSTVRVALGPRM